MKRKPKLNVVGPYVRKLRDNKGWSQAMLARKLQLLGWSISRHSIAKLELQIRRVSDCELLYFAHVLGVTPSHLYPKKITWRELGARFQTSHRTSLFPARGDK
jgi:transcriptional regulator with XRE-family HTH domain